MCDGVTCGWGNLGRAPSNVPFFSPKHSAATGCVSIPRFRATNYAYSKQGCKPTVKCLKNFVNPNEGRKKEPKFLNRPTITSGNWWKSSETTTCACLSEQGKVEDDFTRQDLLETLREMLLDQNETE